VDQPTNFSEDTKSGLPSESQVTVADSAKIFIGQSIRETCVLSVNRN
jgi:hypothetical protein